MLYGAYHYYQKTMKPLNLYSKALGKVATFDFLPLNKSRVGRHFLAGTEMVERFTRDYPRPPFPFDHTFIDGRRVGVEEEIVLSKPFCDLRRFKREGRHDDPRVLIVAPMAGHYASLMRYTVKEFLPDHDVYITDWQNARDVPLSEGDFGVEDFVDYVMDFLREIGPGSNILSACQPCPLVLAAVSALAMKGDPAQPKSMVLMAGPVDPRINPSKMLKNGDKISPDMLEKLVIDRVPSAYAGRGRRVYAGFRQLSFFMSANFMTHIRKHWEFYRNIVKDNVDEAEAHRVFYDNYMAVMDGTATFWKETVTRVFFEHHLPKGTFVHHGQTVDPGAVKKTALLTVEGENDEFCPPGQTEAAHALCSRLPKKMRGHFVQEGVGHYGVFSGSKFSEHIAPLAKQFMSTAAAGKAVPAKLKL
jgi:poly(3-hydroxybutyrate) depolymerase